MRFEYRAIVLEGNDTSYDPQTGRLITWPSWKRRVEQLNRLGEDGWELVGFDYSGVAHFKRPKEEAEGEGWGPML